eukprot:11968729-Ditylum_brightwellii.AAC.1
MEMRHHLPLHGLHQKFLTDLPEEYDGEAVTPAANHLLDVNKSTDKLNEGEAQAKLCLQTSVAFLGTHIKEPNIDNNNKLRWMLQYLPAIIDLPLTLEADDLGQLTWWVDAAFAVHHDMYNHNGGMLLRGKGGTLQHQPNKT